MSDQDKQQSGDSGNGNAAGAIESKKRKIRTPEEILKDIEAEEAEAIRKVKARAAEKKAEVQTKMKAASKKTVAVELLDKYRADIKAASRNEAMTDEAADEVLRKIVEEGVGRLAAATASAQTTDAANAAPVAQAA